MGAKRTRGAPGSERRGIEVGLRTGLILWLRFPFSGTSGQMPPPFWPCEQESL